MILIYGKSCAGYCAPGHPERPERVVETAKLLREQEEIDIEWRAPGKKVGEELLLRAHSAQHLENIKTAEYFDADTPAYPEIFQHAEKSVAAALVAMDAALQGQPAFSLMRPPGHHAERDRAMGFCYLNQVAICALEALEGRGLSRVAVFDFDVHHGNGTEDILRENPRAAYFSVHQYPAYPGSGGMSGQRGMNCPVSPIAPAEEYMKACRRALDGIRAWEPELLIVSAGFDAYRLDPLAAQRLRIEDFRQLGQWIAETGVPHFSVLEGGYSKDLPKCVLGYLSADV